MKSIVDATIGAITRNIRMVLFFSVPFLLAFIIPLLTPLPSYLAIGGVFVRFDSIPLEMSLFDSFVIALLSALSLFLFAFTVVNLNIVIKSQRTLTSIRSEVLEGITKYTISVFILYFCMQIIVLVLSYFYGIAGIIASSVLLLPILFAPAAMVIDEYGPFHAMRMSVKTITTKPHLFVQWLLLGVLLLSVVDVLVQVLSDVFGIQPFAQWIVVVINAMVLLPFLTIMQTQIYLSKYTLLR